MNTLTTIQSTTTALDTFVRNQTSPCTQLAYNSDLRQFFQLVPIARAGIREVKVSDIVDYRNSLAGRYRISSVNRKLSVIKAFFKWLVDSGHVSVNPTEVVKLFPADDNANTEALSDDEVRRILQVVDNPLHHAVLVTLFYLGLRGAELRKLQMISLGEDRGVTTLEVWGKGSKKRIIPLPKEVLDSINSYLVTYRARWYTHEPLFTARGLKPLSQEFLRKILIRYAKKAGIEKTLSPHSCRATCISNAIENGANQIQVQHLAGWSSPAMIQRYDKRSQILKNSAVYAVNYGVKNE